mmetsp:Transcript_8266/g.30489  ORF Transcript_8266/g.30489 Transcript_8266/m.30489 type:complete len:618 (+) Transcript_8266:147-2000(+)|eukprot:scaffold5277_cov404-Prasinococcus_capsulatus_cf.AAC.16
MASLAAGSSGVASVPADVSLARRARVGSARSPAKARGVARSGSRGGHGVVRVSSSLGISGGAGGRGKQVQPPSVLSPTVEEAPLDGITEEERLAGRNGGGGDDGIRGPFAQRYRDYATGYCSLPGVSCEKSEWLTEVEGEIPPELCGTLLRNGPALFSRGETRKSYLDGDGMVVAVAFKDGKAYLRNKFVRTESFVKEEALGRYTEPSIFTAKEARKPAWFWRLFNDILMGNLERKHNGAYNVINWGGSLVAVDYSKPYLLDPKTLETKGHGLTPLSSAMHTSHYRTVDDHTSPGKKRLVAFLNEVDWRSQTTLACFYEFDEDGNEVERNPFPYESSYVHDLIVTDNWYILFDCPIKIDMESVFTKYIWEKACLSESISEDRARRPLFRMFPRGNNKSKPVTCEADYWCYAYHHVNGYEQDGKVVFDTCTWSKFTLYFNDICKPNGVTNYPRMKLSRFVLDTETGKATHTKLSDTPCELPITNWNYTGKPYRHMYLSTSNGTSPEGINGPMQSLTKVSLASTDKDNSEVVANEELLFGERKFAMEPFFVQRPGTTEEDDGWVLCLVHDAEVQGTEVVIIDAKKFSEGAVATIKLPQYVPFGVHGSWSNEYVAGPDGA